MYTQAVFCAKCIANWPCDTNFVYDRDAPTAHEVLCDGLSGCTSAQRSELARFLYSFP